jgi:uncharacterized protein YaaQ
MKLIIAIVKDIDNDSVSSALTHAGFGVTFIASTGGFLRRGNSTLLIGLEDEKVDQALEIIRKTCSSAQASKKNGEKNTVIFVLNVEKFVHF